MARISLLFDVVMFTGLYLVMCFTNEPPTPVNQLAEYQRELLLNPLDEKDFKL